MTTDEWDELTAWIDDRFPNQWHAEQRVAYYEDLKGFDASDVWTALYGEYNRGVDFAPKGSKLKAGAAESRRQAAIEDRYDQVALPEPVGERKPKEGWVADRYPGETVTGYEHVRRWHRSKGPCGSRFCDIHNPELAKQEETR